MTIQTFSSLTCRPSFWVYSGVGFTQDDIDKLWRGIETTNRNESLVQICEI